MGRSFEMELLPGERDWFFIVGSAYLGNLYKLADRVYLVLTCSHGELIFIQDNWVAQLIKRFTSQEYAEAYHVTTRTMDEFKKHSNPCLVVRIDDAELADK